MALKNIRLLYLKFFYDSIKSFFSVVILLLKPKLFYFISLFLILKRQFFFFSSQHNIPPYRYLIHPLILIFLKSSSASSGDPFIGLPLILLPAGFHYYIFHIVLFASILTTCFSYASYWLLTNLITLVVASRTWSSVRFLRILHDPSSYWMHLLV